METCLPFTDDVMVVLVHKCVQQTHLLALHLETLGYIHRLLKIPFSYFLFTFISLSFPFQILKKDSIVPTLTISC